MEKRYTVYMHIALNNKKYIGITCKNPKYRWNNGKGYKPNKHFYNAILKYGWNNIKHLIICSNLSKKDACDLEMQMIKMYKSNDIKYGYNQSLGGENTAYGCRWKLTEETKRKLSKIKKGKPTWNKGKHCWSDEQKKRIGEKQNRKVICIETKIVFQSLNEAEKITGVKYQGISRVCRGGRKTAGGYHWEYYDEVA